LGPEESGRVLVTGWFGFSGSRAAPAARVHPLGGMLGVGVVVWLGPALTILLVGGPRLLGGFAWWCGLLGVSGGRWGRWSCPYFENCIVDASIFVVFCCVTSY
jgi:hypothetical protein